MWVAFFKLLFACSLIYWLLERGSLDLSILKQVAHPTELILLLGFYFALMLNNNVRWRYFLKIFEVDTSFKEAFKLSFIGLFFNFAMLGGVGGDLVKGYYITKQHSDQKVQAAMSILFDRISGVYTMLLVGLTMMFFKFDFFWNHPQLKMLFLFTSILFALFSFLLIVCFHHCFREMYKEIIFDLPYLSKNLPHNAVIFESFKPSHFIIGMCFSLLTVGLCIAFFITSAFLMDFNIPLWIYVYAVPLSFIFMAIPIAPGGIGTGQVAALGLFSWGLGQETQVGPAVVSAFQVIGILWGLLGVIFYLQIKTDFKNSLSNRDKS